MKKSYSIEGKDNCGNNAFINVRNEDGKIFILSSEDCNDVVLTKDAARELITYIKKCINCN